MVLAYFLLALSVVGIVMAIRVRRKQKERKKALDTDNVTTITIDLNAIRATAKEAKCPATQEKDRRDLVDIAYEFLLVSNDLIKSPITHIEVMNRKMKELHRLSGKLTELSQRADYNYICAQAIADHVDAIGVRPTNKIVGMLSSEDKRLAFLSRLPSAFVVEYISYWDSVLSSYKRKAARINRIQYLINNISVFSEEESYLGPDVTTILADYKCKLSERLTAQ